MVAMLVIDMIGRCRQGKPTGVELAAIAINGALIILGVFAIFQEGR